jgi:hypothetical protein
MRAHSIATGLALALAGCLTTNAPARANGPNDVRLDLAAFRAPSGLDMHGRPAKSYATDTTYSHWAAPLNVYVEAKSVSRAAALGAMSEALDFLLCPKNRSRNVRIHAPRTFRAGPTAGLARRVEMRIRSGSAAAVTLAIGAHRRIANITVILTSKYRHPQRREWERATSVARGIAASWRWL